MGIMFIVSLCGNPWVANFLLRLLMATSALFLLVKQDFYISAVVVSHRENSLLMAMSPLNQPQCPFRALEAAQSCEEVQDYIIHPQLGTCDLPFPNSSLSTAGHKTFALSHFFFTIPWCPSWLIWITLPLSFLGNTGFILVLHRTIFPKDKAHLGFACNLGSWNCSNFQSWCTLVGFLNHQEPQTLFQFL